MGVDAWQRKRTASGPLADFFWPSQGGRPAPFAIWMPRASSGSSDNSDFQNYRIGVHLSVRQHRPFYVGSSAAFAALPYRPVSSRCEAGCGHAGAKEISASTTGIKVVQRYRHRRSPSLDPLRRHSTEVRTNDLSVSPFLVPSAVRWPRIARGPPARGRRRRLANCQLASNLSQEAFFGLPAVQCLVR